MKTSLFFTISDELLEEFERKKTMDQFEEQIMGEYCYACKGEGCAMCNHTGEDAERLRNTVRNQVLGVMRMPPTTQAVQEFTKDVETMNLGMYGYEIQGCQSSQTNNCGKRSTTNKKSSP